MLMTDAWLMFMNGAAKGFGDVYYRNSWSNSSSWNKNRLKCVKCVKKQCPWCVVRAEIMLSVWDTCHSERSWEKKNVGVAKANEEVRKCRQTIGCYVVTWVAFQSAACPVCSALRRRCETGAAASLECARVGEEGSILGRSRCNRTKAISNWMQLASCRSLYAAPSSWAPERYSLSFLRFTREYRVAQ